MKLVYILFTLFLTSCNFSESGDNSGLVSNPNSDDTEIFISFDENNLLDLSLNYNKLTLNKEETIEMISEDNLSDYNINFLSCETELWTSITSNIINISLNENTKNTLYIKGRDSNGDETNCLTIEIIHDNTNPEAPTSIINGNNGSDIASDLAIWDTGVDTLSGISHYEYALSVNKDESGMLSDWIIVNGNSYQITEGLSLIGNTDYYTLVRSVDKLGLKSPIKVSDPWQITVSPEKITNLEISNRSMNSISLGWSIPLDNGTPITDYDVYYKETNSLSWIKISKEKSSHTGYIISGLNADSSYDFKVRAYNEVNYSDFSNTLSASTLPDLQFFQEQYKAINIGGATKNQIVSFVNSNNITITDVSLGTENNITLNKGETYSFDAEEFDVVSATDKFYVAGLIGSSGAGADKKGNITWQTSSWVGKEFYFNLTRNAPLIVKVYAFEDCDITITKAGVVVDSISLTKEIGHTFSLADIASYEMTSTGLISGFIHATTYTDPRPLIPASNDIIGFPSSKAMITSSEDSNRIELIHSNSVVSSITVNKGSTKEASPQGTSSLFKSQALRLRSDNVIVANSNADSNGYCSSPFIPVSMLKSKYAINVNSDFVAFASDRPVDISVINPDGSSYIVSLIRSGLNVKAPYYARIGTTAAGTIFEGSDKFQAWYQPNSDNFGGDEDETILFGWE